MSWTARRQLGRLAAHDNRGVHQYCRHARPLPQRLPPPKTGRSSGEHVSSVLQSSTVDSFSKKLRWWRRRRRLTQHQLADRSHVSRATIARLETARHDPTLSVMRKLATALRVNL